MTRILLPLLAAFGLLLGCTSSPTMTPSDTLRRIESIARIAAFATVSAEIRSDPELREDFGHVASGLSAMIAAERWDLAAATEIVMNAGVRRLRGPDGQIVLQAGMLVLLASDVTFDVGKTEHAVALIRGLESGVRLALTIQQ